MNILIVDDEEFARKRLENLLRQIDPNIRIFEAGNALEVLEQAAQMKPDIALLDIRLPGGIDGLELAAHLSSLSQHTAVIFITAYQQHAIKAFDMNAIDYLLKPIGIERLKIALKRAMTSLKKPSDELNLMANLVEKRTHVSAVVNGSIRLMKVMDIYYFKADQKYVQAVARDGSLLLDESLNALEHEFSEYFLRIHRNALVGLKYISSVGRNHEGKMYLRFKHIDTELAVSRRHSSRLKSVLRSLHC